MKKMIFLSLVLLFLATMAWAQEKLEAPVWNVGDKWTFKRADGATFYQEILDVKEDMFILKMGGDKDLYGYDKKTMNIKYVIEESGRQVKSTSVRKKLLDFPIFVGKKWTDTTTSIPAGGQTEVTYVNELR